MTAALHDHLFAGGRAAEPLHDALLSRRRLSQHISDRGGGGRDHEGCHYLIIDSLSGYVCVTFVVFTDFESCTRPISTNSRSMEAGEYGLTRGTCFAARRLEVVAVAGLPWISWCFGCGGIFSRFFFAFFFPSNAHGLLKV